MSSIASSERFGTRWWRSSSAIGRSADFHVALGFRGNALRREAVSFCVHEVARQPGAEIGVLKLAVRRFPGVALGDGVERFALAAGPGPRALVWLARSCCAGATAPALV